MVDATGSTKTFQTIDTSVQTDSPSNVDRTSATLNGTVTELNSPDVDVWFEWGEVGNNLPNSTTKESLSSSGSFSREITSLNSGTSYEFRAKANDGSVETNGDTLSFIASVFTKWKSITDGTVYVDIS